LANTGGKFTLYQGVKSVLRAEFEVAVLAITIALQRGWHDFWLEVVLLFWFSKPFLM